MESKIVLTKDEETPRTRTVHGVGYVPDEGGILQSEPVGMALSGTALAEYEKQEATVNEEAVGILVRTYGCSEQEAKQRLGIVTS